ncbi:MAG TPA: hypothetical protein VF698_06990 [Thermoanaerobaculia bacterium]
MRNTAILFAVVLLAACQSATTAPAPEPQASAPPPNPAPWSNPPLNASEVPRVYMQQWMRAENRRGCALIAPMLLGEEGKGAAPRAATFAGGWAVSYDTDDVRSAFGVAGTGTSLKDGGEIYDDWPVKREWDDGSRAGYGPEGGTGPNELAYVRVAGQDCLYNVWSRLGRDHLESLIENLRFVRTDR